ncbi:unnamed protein product [Prunus armeniaca]|uniref:Uncharacterized protein n=1 Tax=Prunus armeniaca TaxID=36596 RepID=A0A6J5VG47_PRUAR|nr:unnamed protein product [Prunus armeniaca]CAB4318342.1 unnamed protein product [Prunus armeniaca]
MNDEGNTPIPQRKLGIEWQTQNNTSQYLTRKLGIESAYVNLGLGCGVSCSKRQHVSTGHTVGALFLYNPLINTPCKYRYSSMQDLTHTPHPKDASFIRISFLTQGPTTTMEN